MNQKIFYLLTFISISYNLNAQNDFKNLVNSKINRFTIKGDVFVQRDLTNYVNFVVSKTNKEVFIDKNQQLWLKYANSAQPSVATLQKYFDEAGKEFGVPSELLKAIGQVENNLMQIGPSIDNGWGIMHLVDNNYCYTLKEASQIIDIDIQTIKDNPKQNIRAAAALIAKYAGVERGNFYKLEDWFEAVKKFTGLINSDLQEMQAENYFKVFKNGKLEMTLWEEYIVIEKNESINIQNKLIYKNIREKQSKNVDYPGAIDELTTCNFSSRNGTDIDTWVNHHIGTGTVAGAISWFQNCDAQVSAHFILAVDGTLYQSVNVADKAWHCGATGYPLNNSRSIGIEHDVTISTPNNWNSMAMITKSTDVARYFCDMYSIPKTRTLPGIRGHNEMPGTNTQCPGELPWDIWMNLLNQNTTSSMLDNFDVNVGHFNQSPTYSGTTTGIALSSTWQRVTSFPQSGEGCMEGVFTDDISNTNDWVIRLLSGSGSASNNSIFEKQGKISFWLKTENANSGAKVCVWVDDSDGTEQSALQNIINDGQWHEYQFDLENFNGTQITGNGEITGPYLTIDAIVLKQPHSTIDWNLFVDEVKYIKNSQSNVFENSSSGVSIYPNPVDDLLNIKLSENSLKTDVRIFDISGKLLIQSIETTEIINMNISFFKSGIYILKIKTDNNSLTQKIIKK